MTQPDAIEALSAELRKDIAAVWAAMVASQTALANDWYLLIPAVRVSRLAEFERVLRDLADQADAIAARHVTAIMKGAYEVGAFTAATTAEASSGARVIAAFGGIDVNAITVLAQDTYQDLLQATQYVRESTKDTVRTLARDQVRAKLYEGKTAIQSGKDLAKQLLDDGITSVTYKNGTRVGLDTYTEMVARTKSAIAYQEGMFNQAAALGVKYMEISDGPGCGLSSHEDPVKADGLILTLEEARQYPISHPNCVMPDTVSGFYGGAQQLIRAWYDGPSYTLTWTTPVGAHTATVGPNHPVLTSRGWVRASLLHEGDELIHDTHSPHPVLGNGGEADLEQVPPSIEQSFEAFRAVGTYTRVPATSDDFHGDAVFTQGDVDVVDVDRVLLVEGDPTFLEHVAERELVRSDVVAAHEVAHRPLEQFPVGTLLASDGVMGGCGAGGALLRGRLGCCEDTGLGDGAADTHVSKALADRRGAEAKTLANFRARELLVNVQASDLGIRDGVRACHGAELGAGVGTEDRAAPRACDAGGECPAELERALVAAEALRSLRGFDVESGVAVFAGLVDRQGFLRVTVERIEVGRHVGWVYDATCGDGAFTANSIVVANCRRSSSCRADLETAEDVAAATPTEPLGQTAAQKKAAQDYADAQARAPKRTARASKATAKTTSMTRAGVTQSAAERAHQKLVTPPA